LVPLCLCGELPFSAADLELKSALKLDHSSGQATFRATEKRVLDLGARAVEIEWLQIQDIEDIEKVCLYLQEPSFTEQATQAELFADRQVDVKVTRSTKRVAADARQLEPNRRRGAEEGRTTAWKIAPGDEGVV
jgi:hypothetical protein